MWKSAQTYCQPALRPFQLHCSNLAHESLQVPSLCQLLSEMASMSSVSIDDKKLSSSKVSFSKGNAKRGNLFFGGEHRVPHYKSVNCRPFFNFFASCTHPTASKCLINTFSSPLYTFSCFINKPTSYQLDSLCCVFCLSVYN